jgi:LuxR family transcriptional regulator, maltose regulon positive regulatory protein
MVDMATSARGPLLAEVLDRQDEKVRRLLLRTSLLQRVNGQLADLLTGDSGSERVLQDLEAAGAFVVAVDARRSWFRYPRLLADLLRLELRRSESPLTITELHGAAAGWFAEHGFAVEAIRHAQAAQDWELAARLLLHHGPGLHRRSLEAAERYLELAARRMASAPADRRGKLRVLLGVVRLLAARQRENLPAVAEEARQLHAAADAPGTAQLGADLRALALVSLGITEIWTGRFGEGQWLLEQGIALARRIGLPFLEFTGLAYQAPLESFWSVARAAERSMHAIELARGHGWTDDPAASIAYLARADALVWQGRLDEAEPWVRQAERTVRLDAEPAAGLALYYVRGRLALVRGHDQEALGAFEATERLAAFLAVPHLLMPRARAELLHVLVRMGDTERAEHALAGLSDQEREPGEIRIATAALRLAQGRPRAVAAVLAPVLDGSAPVSLPTWLVRALLLQATTCDALGDPAAARRALERALDLAEPDRALSAFVLQPTAGLLQRHARNCAKHADLIAEIVRLLPGGDAEPGSRQQMAPPEARQAPAEAAPRATEQVSRGESRVLRYLPTNLSAPEIAGELSVSVNTIRTHMRHLFVKLGVHSRTEAVVRARSLGLLPRWSAAGDAAG